MNTLRTVSLLLPALIFSACGTAEIVPVAIEDHDMCSFCRMAISEKEFAAEIIATDEKVYKFDDVGCMLKFAKNEGDALKPAAIFVTDFDSRQWIKAHDAFFVKTGSIKTPMSGGLIPFADKAKADAFAASSGSTVMRFNGLSVPEH
ncbi:MAG: nitrous oxide reductase accessory protein NosL [Chloracidobacterium sp.]|nr:nitrous oxide reductase accessory protein NosL [Chloracidobacterium sp.]MCO5333446.1 nitrous oxide reductase accessory protein NosL [Pyrinomonadaceae bacterium]